MGSYHVDPVAGRAFFRDASVFMCALVPPDADDPKRSALLAFALGSGDEALADGVDLASNASRHAAIVLERIALGTDAWPACEPPHATSYVAERGGFVVLAPSVDSWVHMPPARRHHLVQLIAAMPADGEAAARAALAALGTCGLVARVHAVLLGDSGAEIDAVVCSPGTLKAGWFVRSDDTKAPRAEDDAPHVHAVAAAPPARVVDRDALLNEALAAYLAPSPGAQRLDAYLGSVQPIDDFAAIRAELDALLRATDNTLWAQEPGVAWSPEFERNLFDTLVARHAWLTPVGFASLLVYAKWLCWHEGLNAP